MGKTYDEIDGRLRAFIEAQQMFFVATAPDVAGHVNLSPKGLDTLRIVDPNTLIYLDYVGSGAETIAHLGQNRRITIMFCAFDGAPNILRIYGQGEALEPGDPGFERLRGMFPASPARAIIRISIERISDSCGFGVPRYSYEGQRDQLIVWADRKGEDGLRQYQRDKNATSIYGLPALKWAQRG
jgi:hypothetical protein